MNYKPLIRKNKRTIKDFSAMVLWLFILIFLIQYTARTENTNPGLAPTLQMQNIRNNSTVTQMLRQPESKTLIRSNFEKAGAPNKAEGKRNLYQYF